MRADCNVHLPEPHTAGRGRGGHQSLHHVRQPQPQVPGRDGAGGHREGPPAVRGGPPAGGDGLPGVVGRDAEAQDAGAAVPDDQPCQRGGDRGQADHLPARQHRLLPARGPGHAHHAAGGAVRAQQRVVHRHHDHRVRTGRRAGQGGGGREPNAAAGGGVGRGRRGGGRGAAAGRRGRVHQAGVQGGPAAGADARAVLGAGRVRIHGVRRVAAGGAGPRVHSGAAPAPGRPDQGHGDHGSHQADRPAGDHPRVGGAAGGALRGVAGRGPAAARAGAAGAEPRLDADAGGAAGGRTLRGRGAEPRPPLPGRLRGRGAPRGRQGLLAPDRGGGGGRLARASAQRRWPAVRGLRAPHRAHHRHACAQRRGRGAVGSGVWRLCHCRRRAPAHGRERRVDLLRGHHAGGAQPVRRARRVGRVRVHRRRHGHQPVHAHLRRGGRRACRHGRRRAWRGGRGRGSCGGGRCGRFDALWRCGGGCSCCCCCGGGGRVGVRV
mmetsp:Transcript_5620/g.17928  ORF Transcript_5620/g.17928 Transcript_5620/m.17928 type:complete len:492 (-) Transcript_5620:340-1815(-)